MNGVAVPRNGLIFGEDGATGSRKVSGWVWGPWDTVNNIKNDEKQHNILWEFGISKKLPKILG